MDLQRHRHLLRGYACYRSNYAGSFPLPLHIVGDGPQKEKYQALTSSLNLLPFVKWLGPLFGNALDMQYRECRALINPSEFNETFGLTNLEAMSHGRAVVCSDRGAFSEVVRHGEDGYVVPSRNPSILAEYMAKVDPRLGLQFGHSGYRHANCEFSKSSHLNDLEQVYTSLISEKSS